VFYNKSKKKVSELPIEHQLALSGMPWIQSNEEINFIDDTFGHKVYDEKWNAISIAKFTKDLESKWTIRLYELSGSLYNVIKNNMVLFVDELDTSLHPLLVREIIKLFYLLPNSKSQLIFNAHDISLIRKEIELFNKDQIRFADKNRYWASSIYSLEEFKKIRSNDLEKMYLEWRFSAIPKTKAIAF
jgi:AAA15 family ATPase/GTPase